MDWLSSIANIAQIVGTVWVLVFGGLEFLILMILQANWIHNLMQHGWQE